MSPIINGMETDKFQPDFRNEDNNPTAIQLSHVYDLKDIKNAINAASIIVNQFKISNYQLLVYGSTTKDLDYTSECRGMFTNKTFLLRMFADDWNFAEMIGADGLQQNVFLMGLGNAPKVLPKGWLFLNSSQSVCIKSIRHD